MVLIINKNNMIINVLIINQIMEFVKILFTKNKIFILYFQEKKYQPVGSEKDLVEGLERDIVQKDPNVRW
jgi:hypothetical protein